MEEDIEILKRITISDFYTSNIYDNVKNVNLAIKNLITRNKELESALNNSVSKDEIKEKIEEYQENMKKYEYADKNIFNENNIRQEVITVLQELLNKGE